MIGSAVIEPPPCASSSRQERSSKRELLADKAAISALHVLALGAKADLGLSDAALQHWVYVHKYSKRKG